LKELEKRLLRKISRSKFYEVTKGWRKLSIEELRAGHYSAHINEQIK
jgi:hypothetical protein